MLTKVWDAILTESQRLALPCLILGVSYGNVSCSNQAPGPGPHSGPRSGDNDLDANQENANPGNGGTDYGSGGDAPVKDPADPSIPPVPEEVDDTPTLPQPITGAPTDEKPLEEGQTVREGLYMIQNFFTKKCLAVHQGKATEGAQIVQSPCGYPEAKFYISFVDKKYYRFQNQLTHFAMQIRGQLGLSEALIEQAEYRARDHQKWIIEHLEDHTVVVRSAIKDSLCLDVAFGSKNDNVAIQLWRECNALGQKWVLVQAD